MKCFKAASHAVHLLFGSLEWNWEITFWILKFWNMISFCHILKIYHPSSSRFFLQFFSLSWDSVCIVMTFFYNINLPLYYSSIRAGLKNFTFKIMNASSMLCLDFTPKLQFTSSVSVHQDITLVISVQDFPVVTVANSKTSPGKKVGHLSQRSGCFSFRQPNLEPNTDKMSGNLYNSVMELWLWVNSIRPFDGFCKWFCLMIFWWFQSLSFQGARTAARIVIMEPTIQPHSRG